MTVNFGSVAPPLYLLPVLTLQTSLFQKCDLAPIRCFFLSVFWNHGEKLKIVPSDLHTWTPGQVLILESNSVGVGSRLSFVSFYKWKVSSKLWFVLKNWLILTQELSEKNTTNLSEFCRISSFQGQILFLKAPNLKTFHDMRDQFVL